MVDRAKQQPKAPGVYLMKDKTGKVIYVGKSKALHNRLLQYFTALGRHNAKTARLVQKIATFDCMYTRTEMEALVLENEMIKLYSPHFNIRLKDDKGYAYLKVDTKSPFPRLTMSRNRTAGDTSRYFGPFASTKTVYALIHTVSKIFQLPTCRLEFPCAVGKHRPCLHYHMNRCVGVCRGVVSAESYREQIKNALLFLQEGYRGVAKKLTADMNAAAEALEFEEAARLRDTLKALEKLGERQEIVTGKTDATDVFGYASDDTLTVLSVLILRDGRVADSTCFYFGADEILDADAFSSFLLSFYALRQPPRVILLPNELVSEDLSAQENWLSEKAGRKVMIKSAERGEPKRLLALADENAHQAKSVRSARDQKSDEIGIELASLLSLEVVPERIESYDISSSGADHWRGGMIVLENGAFSKKHYRSFKIRTDEKSDVAAMEEVLFRRFSHKDDPSFPPLPDLILLDGGLPQLTAARRAMEKAEIQIPCFGMVKDEHHKTRTLLSTDGEIAIAGKQRIFTFIYRIQEEVHRFALSQMNRARRAGQVDSSLEKIPGIGKVKAKKLLSFFRTLRAIREADEATLASVKGISKNDAKNIADAFRDKV